MKTIVLTTILLILSATTIFFFFRGLDSAMEIDNLKEQIKLQRNEMHFLEGLANSAFSSCKISVTDFENSVRANGRDVLWQGDDALIGPFRVKRKESCMVNIEAVVGL